jgi:hypothetical protein
MGMRRQRAGTAKRIGSLFDDLAVAASSVYAALVEGDVVVWLDRDGVLWSSLVEPPLGEGAERLVGRYRMGASASDIEDDLRELRRASGAGSILFD